MRESKELMSCNVVGVQEKTVAHYPILLKGCTDSNGMLTSYIPPLYLLKVLCINHYMFVKSPALTVITVLNTSVIITPTGMIGPYCTF